MPTQSNQCYTATDTKIILRGSRMRKALVFVVVLILCLTYGVAANVQKIHAVDSDVYEAISNLYISNGYALPSTAGPWSTGELMKMLMKIDRSTLGTAGQSVYDYVLGMLTEDEKTFQFGVDVALEGYFHTDTVNFTEENDWIRDSEERKPLIDLKLETWLAEHFYGYSSLTITGRRYHEHTSTDGPVSDYYGVHGLTSNLFFLYGHNIGDLDFGMPYRVFGAFGGDAWSVQIGRDKLSWGPGVSGNFMLSDHFRYHDTGRIALYGDTFKYTFATSFFPHPSQYYPIMEYDMNSPNYGKFINQRSQDQPLGGMQMFIGHRLEWRLFKEKVGLVVSEAIMYQSTPSGTQTQYSADTSTQDSILDLRILNPSMIFHNLYVRSNANSLLALELDFTPINHINVYTQIAIDEFSIPGEGGTPGVADKARPSALGMMVGAKASYPIRKGMMYGSFEWAKTDPYLYVRDNGKREHTLGEYGMNFVGAHREYAGASSHMALVYIEEFLGYQYGPDAIVLNGNVGYREYGKWFAEGNVFYMLHGTHDKWTLWSHVYNEANVDATQDKPPYLSTPTDKHWTENNGDIDAQSRDAVSKMLVMGIKGGYTLLPGLEMYAQTDFINMVNPGNRSTNPTISDVQLTFGISYSL